MPKLNGGQALIQSLLGEGLRTLFGLPGAGQYEAVDALYAEPGIRYISVRHEQATTYMADGYARASGEIAGALVVQGPGLFNAMAGVATAYATSSPMLVVSGDHHHRKKGLDLDHSAWLGPLTKWTARAQRPAEIPALVQEAFRQLRSGRPRPVGLQISPAVFSATEDVTLLDTASPESIPVDGEIIRQAAEVLLAAQKPVIWAGGGVMRSNAADAVAKLSKYLQIPVVTTRQGKGTLPEDHPLCLRMAERRFTPLGSWLDQRDMILVVGASENFASFTQQIVQIDIDETELAAGESGLAIYGDARDVLTALLDSVRAATAARPVDTAVQAEIAAINASRFDPAKQLQPQWGFMQAIRSALPDDGVLVQGMNQMGYYSRNYFAASAPNTFLTCSSHGTLGSAYPIALGAKVAQPDRAVVAFCGDGGFLYNVQELATAAQYGINAVAIVFNDNAYGNVLRAQMEEFDEHVIGTKLHNPDFPMLAHSFGVRGQRAEDADALEKELSAALGMNKPTLIEVPVGMLDREF